MRNAECGTTKPDREAVARDASPEKTADNSAIPHSAYRIPDSLQLHAVSYGYGPTPVLQAVSLAVPDGGFLTLLGPSGCGKTTLLKLVGGYLTPAAGTIRIRERDMTGLPPEKRNVGMVFQSYALFPHLSARENVAFGLAVRGLPRAEVRRRADGMLDRVGLGPAERDRRPAGLSGGQQQRVALARALVIEPDVLLLDEPFANLDRHLKEQLRGELRRLQRETGVTTVMVTHDQDEALAVSDLVGVMSGGRVLQLGTPAELYHRPRTPFVARFLGEANVFDGSAVGYPPGRPVLVRPEGFRLDPSPECRWVWDGSVTGALFLGADVLVDVACLGGPAVRVRARAGGGELSPGARVRVGIAPDAVWPIPEPDPTP